MKLPRFHVLHRVFISHFFEWGKSLDLEILSIRINLAVGTEIRICGPFAVIETLYKEILAPVISSPAAFVSEAEFDGNFVVGVGF
jgi:hypothetical protein